MDKKQLVKEAFEKGSEELLNCERAIDLVETTEGDVTTITFNVDCDRYGIHRGSSVVFGKDIDIILCERVELCGIEEIMKDELKLAFSEKM